MTHHEPDVGFAHHDHDQPVPGFVTRTDTADWVARAALVDDELAARMLDAALAVIAGRGHDVGDGELLNLTAATWAADSAALGIAAGLVAVDEMATRAAAISAQG